MTELTRIKSGNNEFIVIVLEEGPEFAEETTSVHLVPVKWAEEHNITQYEEKDIPMTLKRELDQYKIQHLKAFYEDDTDYSDQE